MTQTNTTQNKEELNKFYKKHQHYFQDPMNENFVQDDFDEMVKDIENLLSQAHQSGIEEGKKSNRDFVIKLKADMAHAIGFCRGLGHPETYLEKNYPELCSKENK